MFTTCPKCALNLAITAADLRIGQGYVRCGRCANVFNALVGLADEAEAEPAGPTGPAVAPNERPREVAGSRSEDAQESESEAEPEPEPELHSDEEGDAAAQTGESAMLVEASLVEGDPGTGTFETIVLEGDGVTQTTEVVGEDEVDQQLIALAQQIEAANAEVAAIPMEESGDVEVLELRDPDWMADRAHDEALARLALVPPVGSGIESDGEAEIGDLSDPSQERGRLLRNLGILGCALLGLLLVIQLVHHYRTQLAAGPLAAPLGAIYGALGLSLQPGWDLRAYELRQLGAQASPAQKGEILLRASVRNTAARAQPLPVLRVTLQDRFGNAIGHSEVRAPDYLRGATSNYLAPDQRVDAQITVQDPGQNAVGFEIDVCLTGDRGVLDCADELGPR